MSPAIAARRPPPAAWPALFLALALAGCARPPAPLPPADGALVVALESAPLQYDPRLGTDQASSRLYELVYSGLLALDPAGALVPDLALGWEALDDGRRLRFHLRHDARFHDGAPLDAADVLHTYESLLDGRVPSAKRSALAAVTGLAAPDRWTVDFLLAEPQGALLATLTSYLGIVPAGATPETLQRRPVGSGPFRVAAASAAEIVLEAFPEYHGGPPRLPRLVLREIPDAIVRALELEKGSVHLAVNALPPDLVPRFRHRARFRVVESPGANYVYLGLNLRDPRLADVRVRRALLLALDRERLVATLWRGLGVVTETLLPPGHWARDESLQPRPRDLAAARRLLDAAGHPDPDGDGPRPRFHLTYKTSTDETALLQAQIVQAMWAEAGVATEVVSHEFATFYDDVRRGAFQVFSLTWTGVHDPDLYRQILHSASVPPAGANRGAFSDPRFDALVAAGGRLLDPAARRPYYVEAQRLLAEELPYLSLFTKVNVAVMPSELAGYVNYPSGELHALATARWEPGR
ncbi:MAG: ABC transporter substrate-binding protein [Thermoanaerobaculia bacterium]|nr:ABC transporter substrate-binding protein [Thermoanaerobaculia bacterium]OQC40455.1 MAG: Periplasmic dipeptide transport protein precursor [Acidobacteria bacterium ADurb.Bin051]MBP7813087.1 ABC transporter substrate-binding protein [Thermoanaerobaculia bacterium]HPA96418.1 ABC transporter substrate-binding protein [Thermoanaerobaculia bacterium]HQN38521.1 ABC transporter substrate-binding protein [Thermoanaerobaculia bacterium]